MDKKEPQFQINSEVIDSLSAFAKDFFGFDLKDEVRKEVEKKMKMGQFEDRLRQKDLKFLKELSRIEDLEAFNALDIEKIKVLANDFKVSRAIPSIVATIQQMTRGIVYHYNKKEKAQ